MSNAERIAGHRRIIQAIRDEISWLEHVQFTINQKSTAELVAEQERIIGLYEAFIAKLDGAV